MIKRLPIVTSMSLDKKVIFLSLDIETRGPCMIRHGILSIGYAVGSAIKNKVINKGRFNLRPLDGQHYDRDTVSGFWAHHKEMRKEMEAQAEHAIQAIVKFRTMLNNLDVKYDVRIVSDNPGFDFGFINYYLCAAGVPTLNYIVQNPTANYDERKKTFRKNYDLDSYVMGVLGSDFDYPTFSKKYVMDNFGFTVNQVSKDHYPENDAEWNYRFLIQLILLPTQ